MAFPVGWTRQCKVTCNHLLVPGSQTSFPALLGYNIVGSENNIPTEMLVASGANAAKSDGSDIRFSSDSAGASPLHCEVVNWTQHATVDASRKAEIWISFNPSTSVDTDVYVWYKNAAATAPLASDATFGSQGVWDANFLSVLHTGDGTSLSTLDSTANAKNITNVSGTAGTGKIGGGYALSGSSQYGSFSNAALTENTYSAWVKLTALPANATLVIGQQDSTLPNSGTYSNEMGVNSAGKVLNYWYNGSTNTQTGGSTLSTGVWYYICITAKTGTTDQRIYVNGSLDAGPIAAGTIFTGFGSPKIAFGVIQSNSSPFASYLNGVLDELRISTVVRSATWITTEYNNVNSISTFWTVGTPATVGGTTITYRRTFTGNMRGR